MKKIISIALIFVLCFTLAACSGKSNKNAIVGEWKATDTDATATFNKDGSCKIKFDIIFNSYDLDADATWKYDKEAGCYYISTATAMNATIETVSDIEYFTLPLIPTRDIVFYRAEDYEKALQLTIEKQKNEIAKTKEGKTKLEFGKAYDFDNGISVNFTDISFNENNLLTVKMNATNNSTADTEFLPYYKSKYYSYGGDASFNRHTQSYLFKGETREYTFDILEYDENIVKALDVFGEFSGIAYFEIGSTEYYIDLGEYITKDISVS
ncbi:MAG: hypothetical protein IIX36_04910 [Clostridia bacterium]|nr:hypothetical protein [Clostridia bacterium]